jgi:hypothetical protein
LAVWRLPPLALARKAASADRISGSWFQSGVCRSGKPLHRHGEGSANRSCQLAARPRTRLRAPSPPCGPCRRKHTKLVSTETRRYVDLP